LSDGETLQERLKRGPMSHDEALTVAKQIAEALRAAHEKGVIHRDLKPANIKITSAGTLKVLDFGLAKALQEQQGSRLHDSPTLMTTSQAGVILGTAAYMSPEQAKGRAAGGGNQGRARLGFHGRGYTVQHPVAMATDAGNVWTLSINDKRTLKPFLQPPYVVRAGTISPDGRWIAYALNETNRFEVYVQAFPNPARQYPISTDGGTEPIWARSGRELFFRNGNKMMAVAVDTKGDKLEAGPPTILFEGRFVVSSVSGGDAWYDVSPDDKRFLMLKADESPNSPSSIVMVQNWTNEVKRLAPPK
jgi:serine/threonine protein kinase